MVKDIHVRAELRPFLFGIASLFHRLRPRSRRIRMSVEYLRSAAENGVLHFLDCVGIVFVQTSARPRHGNSQVPAGTEDGRGPSTVAS